MTTLKTVIKSSFEAQTRMITKLWNSLLKGGMIIYDDEAKELNIDLHRVRSKNTVTVSITDF